MAKRKVKNPEEMSFLDHLEDSKMAFNKINPSDCYRWSYCFYI